jgi:hypothetical protein
VQFEAAGAAGMYFDASDALHRAALDARSSREFAIVSRSKLRLAGDSLTESIVAVREALERVRRGDKSDRRDQLQFEEITSLLGLDEVYALEARYATDATKGR